MPSPLSGRGARRVLLTADAVGGVWTYCLDLAGGLAAAGVETLLVVLGPSPTPGMAAEASAVPGLTLADTGLALDWTASSPAELVKSVAAIRDLARSWRPHVVHLHTPALAAGAGYPAPVVAVCHSCLATWWSAVKGGPLPEDFRWRTQAVRRGMLACDVLLAPSHAFAKAVSRTYDVPLPTVVWNGRDLSRRAASRQREAIVLTSGRLWDEGKNIATLDAAASRIAAPLIAAGPLEGPTGHGVRLHSARSVGRMSSRDMARWLSRAPIYTSAALCEPFGLGVLEAAQAGCALVLSDIPTFRELWDGAAVFAPARDADAFARAIEELLSDPDATRRLSAEAKARSKLYTVAAMTAGVLDAYRQVLPARVVRREAVA